MLWHHSAIEVSWFALSHDKGERCGCSLVHTGVRSRSTNTNNDRILSITDLPNRLPSFSFPTETPTDSLTPRSISPHPVNLICPFPRPNSRRSRSTHARFAVAKEVEYFTLNILCLKMIGSFYCNIVSTLKVKWNEINNQYSLLKEAHSYKIKCCGYAGFKKNLKYRLSTDFKIA